MGASFRGDKVFRLENRLVQGSSRACQLGHGPIVPAPGRGQRFLTHLTQLRSQLLDVDEWFGLFHKKEVVSLIAEKISPGAKRAIGEQPKN